MRKKPTWKNYEDHLLNEQLTRVRIKKLKTMFNICARALDFETATRTDMERFVNDLNRNNFKQRSGKNYSGNAKLDMKKFLKQFYKWYKGDNETYPKEVSFIKGRIAKDERPEEKEILSLEEIKEVASRFMKIDYQIMSLLLFDSGFRIQEMMSVKKKDLTLERVDDKNKCYFIYCNKSKTFTRKVDVPIFTDQINRYINSQSYKNKKPNDPLFDISYNFYRQMLKKYSKEVTGKSVSPHGLRHSSATHYAPIYQGDITLFAPRYGWSFDAGEMKVYIRKSGALQKRTARTSFQNEVTKLREENIELKERIDKIEKTILALAKKEIDTSFS